MEFIITTRHSSLLERLRLSEDQICLRLLQGNLSPEDTVQVGEAGPAIQLGEHDQFIEWCPPRLRRGSAEEDVRVNLIAMSDLTFLLITFFLLTGGSQIRALISAPGQARPGPSTVQNAADTPTTNAIHIQVGSQITVQNQLSCALDASVEQVADLIRKFVHDDTGEENRVYIHPTRSTRYEHVLKVVDAARLSGMTAIKTVAEGSHVEGDRP